MPHLYINPTTNFQEVMPLGRCECDTIIVMSELGKEQLRIFRAQSLMVLGKAQLKDEEFFKY